MRLANWLRLKDRHSGCEFRIVNTHLDHVSQPARVNGARLICEDAAAYDDDYPQFLTGDMNCDVQNEGHPNLFISRLARHLCSPARPEDPGHTYHAFKGPAYEGDIGKMDWVFSRGSAQVDDAQIIDVHSDGRYPSDHYFITADVSLETPA